MQGKIGIRFHRAEINYVEIIRLYAFIKQIQQADYNMTIYQKLRNSNGNTFSFIPVLFF